MATKQQKEATLTVRTSGNINFVDGDVIKTHVPQTNVMIRNQSELTKLADYEAGTIAFTAGYANIWQKDIDGTWVEV